MGLLRRRGGGEPLPVRAPEALLEVAREGTVPLAPFAGSRERLRVAVVVPSFRRGSGGHSTIANLVRGLEARGHACSLWVEDDEGRHGGDDVGELFPSFFGPLAGDVRLGFGEWDGADVAVATGWQTVHRVLRLPGVAGRAYLVQDHEPEFYGTSAEQVWATETYGLGLHCVCASPWLADLVRERYGASASAFDLGVDHDAYRPLPVHRRDDLVLVYGRAVTARRAVPLAVLAMAELKRRRPEVEIALFGEARPVATPFPHRHLGVLAPDDLAHAYNSATVGVVLSMTNPSLVPTEMLACALPTVDLAGASMLATFGAEGPVALAPFEPIGLADAVEGLLDEPLEARAERVGAGLELTAGRTWAHAAEQVERALSSLLSS
jgi:glycosyltransferase involved in cell wall biosynthesis